MLHKERAYSTPEPNKEDLITSVLPDVRRLAFRLARRIPSHFDVNDLISAGCEGLVHASEDFDSTRGASFKAYAMIRVRGAMLDELRNHDTGTRYARDQQKRFSSVVNDLSTKLGRPPKSEEIANELEIPIEKYFQLTERLARLPALGRAADLDPDQVEDHDTDIVKAFTQQQQRELLISAIQLLPERSQQILALYYQEECTQAEIGKILDITESRVCQILGESFGKLKATVSRSMTDNSTEASQ